MELFEYQIKAMNTCMDSSRNMSYMALGLVGEVGELASKIAKGIRKGQVYFGSELEGNLAFPSDSDMHYAPSFLGKDDKAYEFEKGLRAELGDIMWFCAGICEVMGWNMDEIGQENIDKLSARKREGTIEGNGDGITKAERGGE